jgi:hypothetical protein
MWNGGPDAQAVSHQVHSRSVVDPAESTRRVTINKSASRDHVRVVLVSQRHMSRHGLLELRPNTNIFLFEAKCASQSTLFTFTPPPNHPVFVTARPVELDRWFFCDYPLVVVHPVPPLHHTQSQPCPRLRAVRHTSCASSFALYSYRTTETTTKTATKRSTAKSDGMSSLLLFDVCIS